MKKLFNDWHAFLLSEDASFKNSEIDKVSINDILGRLHINSDSWGNPSSKNPQDRSILRGYVESLGGSTPDEILKILDVSLQNNNRTSDKGTHAKCDLSVTISKLQILNTFSRVINNFNSQVSGYINEDFLAAVFNGEVVRVIDSDGVEDLRIGGENISLKTMKKNSSVHGAILDLIKSVLNGEQIVYYIFSKEDNNSIKVYKFTFTEKNIGLAFEKGGLKSDDYLSKGYQILRENPAAKKWQTPASVRALGSEGTWPKSKKWSLAPKHYMNGDGNESGLVAELSVDPEKLMEIANLELGEMVEQLHAVQKDFKTLVFDMHKYLSSMSAQDGDLVKSDSRQFDKSVNANINGDEDCDVSI